MSNSKNFIIAVKNKDTGKEYHIDVTNKTTSYQIKQKLEKENPYLKVEWQMLFDKKDLRINTKTIQDTVESMEIFPGSTILLQLNIPKSELTKIKERCKKFRESWNISLGHDNAAGLDDYILLIDAIPGIGKIDDKDETGQTILQYAVSKGMDEIVHIALLEGANPNKTSLTGNSVLITAIENGSVSIVKLLIEFGANVHQKGTFAKEILSPLQIAQNYLRMSTDYRMIILEKIYDSDVRKYVRDHEIETSYYRPESSYRYTVYIESKERFQSLKDSYEYQHYLDVKTPPESEYREIVYIIEKELEKEKKRS